MPKKASKKSTAKKSSPKSTSVPVSPRRTSSVEIERVHEIIHIMQNTIYKDIEL